MHDAKDQEDAADFGAEDFKGGLGVLGCAAVFEGERNAADVHKVKADDEEVINRIGEAFVAVETVDEKNAAVFVEGASDPDGKGDANGVVGEVGPDCSVHRGLTFCFVIGFFRWQLFLFLQKC